MKRTTINLISLVLVLMASVIIGCALGKEKFDSYEDYSFPKNYTVFYRYRGESSSGGTSLQYYLHVESGSVVGVTGYENRGGLGRGDRCNWTINWPGEPEICVCDEKVLQDEGNLNSGEWIPTDCNKANVLESFSSQTAENILKRMKNENRGCLSQEAMEGTGYKYHCFYDGKKFLGYNYTQIGAGTIDETYQLLYSENPTSPEE